MEVDEEKFYKYRFGGGTTCSSALKFISKQFENRYPPNKWNIYVFYFTDGENWDNDNEQFVKILQEEFNSKIVNMVGITQIMAWNYENSLKQAVDRNSFTNLKTTQITNSVHSMPGSQLSDDDRNQQIKSAIVELLGKDKKV